MRIYPLDSRFPALEYKPHAPHKSGTPHSKATNAEVGLVKYQNYQRFEVSARDHSFLAIPEGLGRSLACRLLFNLRYNCFRKVEFQRYITMRRDI
jgi:hypothetical protein